MRGHEMIITMRQAGQRPAIVFLNDFQCKTDWYRLQEHATVCIDASDAPETLDLRFLVGMNVNVCGSNENRAKAILEACKQHGAKMVAAGSQELSDGRFITTYAEVWHG